MVSIVSFDGKGAISMSFLFFLLRLLLCISLFMSVIWSFPVVDDCFLMEFRVLENHRCWKA